MIRFVIMIRLIIIRFIITIVIAALINSPSGHTTTTIITTNPKQQTTLEETEQQITLEEGPNLGEYNVDINSWTILTDHEGTFAISIVYDFTNYGEEAESFMFAINDEVYQNGIQLDDIWYLKNVDAVVDTKRKIKSGATISVVKTYLLRDATSPISIEIKKSFDLTDDNKLEFIIS